MNRRTKSRRRRTELMFQEAIRNDMERQRKSPASRRL
jgi:hypothetical protein